MVILSSEIKDDTHYCTLSFMLNTYATAPHPYLKPIGSATYAHPGILSNVTHMAYPFIEKQ